MEKQIKLQKDYNSLDKVLNFLKEESNLESSKEYDIWEMRTDSNNQMEQCIVLKKSAMHGMKVYLPENDSLKMTYIIPNKIMHAYFGKSQKRYQNILEIVTNKIKDTLLAGPQKKAFEEMEQEFSKIKA